MSHPQTASSTQAIALNPQALLNAIYWLERAKQHTSDLVDVFATHENDLKLVEIEIEITTALRVISKAVMQGEPITPPAPKLQAADVMKAKMAVLESALGICAISEDELYERLETLYWSGFKAGLELSKGEPLTPPPAQTSTKEQAPTVPQRQTTAHGLEVDGDGYNRRVLLDRDGDYVTVSQHCSPPHGHRQVCIKCSYDRFNEGVHYVKCPECEAAVNYHCRYASIAGGV